MTKKQTRGISRGGAGIGVTDEGDDYPPIKSFKNFRSRIPRDRFTNDQQNQKQCCTFNDTCIIDDDFILGDCN